MANISVIIPWRESRQRDRNIIAEWCFKRYKWLFPYAEFIFCDSGDEIFSRGKSINQGVENCTGDYIIITDADYLFSPTMAKEIVNKQPWTIACKQENYYFTDEYIASSILNKPFDIDIKSINFGNHIQVSPYPTLGQVIGLQRNCYIKFDESMVGYGYEDAVWYYCMKSIHGKEFRTNNKMYHIFHKRPIYEPYMKKSYDNKNYHDKVWFSIKDDRKKMKELIKEKGLYIFND